VFNNHPELYLLLPVLAMLLAWLVVITIQGICESRASKREIAQSRARVLEAEEEFYKALQRDLNK
jgi:hypothetical protein